jgi:hypothetical protein
MSISGISGVAASLLTQSLNQTPGVQSSATQPPDPTQQAVKAHHHHHGGGDPAPAQGAGTGQPATAAANTTTGINTIA